MLEFVVGYTVASKGQARAASLARSMQAAQGGRHTERVEQVNGKVDNLGVIVKAMWSLLEENGFTTDQLMDRIEEIQDQKRAEVENGRKATRCPQCESMVSVGMTKCQYCGTTIDHGAVDPLHDL